MADHVETDALLQQARVTLGGEEHVIRVKSIKETAKFRRLLGELIGNSLAPILSRSEGNVTSADVMRHLVPVLFGDGLDAAPDIVSLYAPETTEALADATDEEIIEAALEVVRLALPLMLRVIESVGKMLAKHDVALTTTA